MLEGHPVVCVTPSGRRRYMALLAPHVLASPVVDRWDLWVNTTVPADLAFFEGLARTDPRVRLVRHPDGAAPCVEALGAFSRLAMDPGTVYVRLDDDVVWAEPGFFERLAAFRLAQREVLDETDVLDGYARLAEGRPDLREATARARALLPEADALADGTDWAWPPRPRGLRARLHRLRKRWTRRKPPRVTLAPGPSF